MAVLSRDALEDSPLADLHVLGRELGIDGFRRLRKAELVDAILARQSGEEPEGAPDDADEVSADAEVDAPADDDEAPKPRRGRRGGRSRSRRSSDEEGSTDEDAGDPIEEVEVVTAISDDDIETEEEAAARGADDDDEKPRRRRGGRTGPVTVSPETSSQRRTCAAEM